RPVGDPGPADPDALGVSVPAHGRWVEPVGHHAAGSAAGHEPQPGPAGVPHRPLTPFTVASRTQVTQMPGRPRGICVTCFASLARYANSLVSTFCAAATPLPNSTGLPSALSTCSIAATTARAS